MSALSRLVRFARRRWQADGTKMLGTLQLILSGWIAIDGLIPKGQAPYFAAANVVLAALTIRRGYINADTANDGQNSGA